MNFMIISYHKLLLYHERLLAGHPTGYAIRWGKQWNKNCEARVSVTPTDQEVQMLPTSPLKNTDKLARPVISLLKNNSQYIVIYWIFICAFPRTPLHFFTFT